MATNELVRAAVNSDSVVQQVQRALDLSERVLPYISVHGLVAEATGLAAGEVVFNDLKKERVQDSVVLLANLAFYLRGVNDGGGNTAIGTAPLNAAQLATLIDKLGI